MRALSPLRAPRIRPRRRRAAGSPRRYHGPIVEFYFDEIDSGLLVLVADGGLNIDTAEQFMQSIEKLVDAGLKKIIVDCSRLTYVSSYGLSILIRLHNRMKKHDGDVKVCCVGGIVPQVLQLTRLDKLFDIHGDVNRARLAFRPRRDESADHQTE